MVFLILQFVSHLNSMNLVPIGLIPCSNNVSHIEC